ncbi:MAG: C25 family cysteine peptidase [Caldilineales bacterium]
MHRIVIRLALFALLVGGMLPAHPVAGQETITGLLQPRVVAAEATTFTFEMDFPAPSITSINEAGRVFHQLELPSLVNSGQPGHPALPRYPVMLGIPAAGDVTLRLLAAEAETLPGRYTLLPAPDYGVQRDALSGEADAAAGVQAQFAWDAAAYAVDRFMPQAVAVVESTAWLRGQRVARVQIAPVQYNPATGTVQVYRHLRIEVSFSDAAAPYTAAAPDVFDATLAPLLLNYEQARVWRTARGAATAKAAEAVTGYPGDTTRPWFKTVLTTSGMVKVTLNDLQGADLAVLAAANPAYLQVWTHGMQVAAWFTGDSDAQFEAGEALLFYADIEPAIYSDGDVYWLTVGDTPGLRMQPLDAAPSGAATDSTAWATVRLEENLIYGKEVPPYGSTVTTPRWYWRDLYNLLTPTQTIPVALNHALTDGYTAIVRLRLQGVTAVAASPDHRVRVELNGHTLGVITWDGAQATTAQLDAQAGWLHSGENSLTLTIEAQTGVAIDRSYLDWVEIRYQHSLRATEGIAAFEAAGGGRREFAVSGFSRPDVLAFDVTTPAAPRVLAAVSIAPTSAAVAGPVLRQPSDDRRVFLPLLWLNASTAPAGNYTVRFGVASSSARAYQVVGLAAMAAIAPLSRDTGSSLQSSSNRADYLLITHRSLWSAAQSLAAYRRTQGLAVTVIDVQDIYDEWSNGRMDPAAIRAFVAQAYAAWQAPAPAYVLLLGGGHFDYRLVTGATTNPVLIPPYMLCADPWTCEVAVDNEYVTVSGSDRMPDLALGRLPAYTLDQATVMVNKIVGYETSTPAGAWRNTITFVADNPFSASGVPDPAGNFHTLTERIIALTPAQYSVKRIFYDPYPNDDSGEPYRYRTAEATTTAILNAVNSGSVIVNYVGHAGTTTWAHETLLRANESNRNDVTQMLNGTRLPIVLDMACASGNFADPQYAGLEVMMLKWAAGGSVAGWGATGFGVATGHETLHRGFYQAVYTGNVRVLGLATAAGKQALWASGINLDLMDTFDLLGDPALRMALP